MAQPEKSIIRSLQDPEIVLDTIDIKDTDMGTLRGGEAVEQTHQLSGDIGVSFPYVTVNGYVFQSEEIIKMVIDQNGLIPVINLEVTLSGSGVFSSQAYPKDGDLISIYIRARNDVFKPIRNDYIITGVSSAGGNTSGQGSTIRFSGTLFIPKLYDEEVRSFKGTSFDALQKIATDLKLGFATNESSTADEQIWICANENYIDWITHIQGSMWKNETSFFSVFIDVYYHLNVINVNNQFSSGFEIDNAILDLLARPSSFVSGDGEPIDYQQETPKVFSNLQQYQGSVNYIEEYKVTNNASNISKKHGYKTQVTIFDMNSLEPWDFDVDPMNTEGSGQDKLILKGRPNPKGETPNADFWQTQIKRRYLGVQYSQPEHNVHDKYLYSKIFNHRNNLELDKMYITLTIEGINFNIYRGERIPAIFMGQEKDLQKGQFDRGDDQEPLNPNDPDATLDRFYSGYYMIGGMTFEYSFGKKSSPYIHQEITLKRREWPMP